MGVYTMWVGPKRFDAKTIERIAKNFLRWRDLTVNGINNIGTHWPIRCDGKLCGELMYDGTFWPADTPDKRPCDVIEDMLAEGLGAGDPRSTEYRAGVRVALEWALMRSPMGGPYPPGSTQADAFAAGRDEGRRLCAGLQYGHVTPTRVASVAKGGVSPRTPVAQEE
jgi:hypothetical protein